METPLSDVALKEFNNFSRDVRQRLENGKNTYGDSSFERPLESIVQEIREEVLDQCGWSFLLYSRLRELESLINLAKKV